MFRYLVVDPTKDFPTTFFTAERLQEFWYYVRWFFKFNMPIAMIGLAVFVAFMVLIVVVDIPNMGKQENDDDDVDVKYY
ncbi:hypothetical protein QYF52_25650 [Paenibacillus polymyxa]|uniref:hypothetical protein n=1 Tax=Paenibacillus polymyxa TaxID=1406 RepID=UPI0025B6680E|nr:hypothetical protein [Paenibacillus polymyxa]MDN4081314.1 hypothetical protein [Paenibacillus polymyxa]MDN4116956.1 hypothetical protein [Paenibacillus polymyxa]